MGAKITKEKWVLPLLAGFFVNVPLLPCPRIITKLPKNPQNKPDSFSATDLMQSRCHDENAGEEYCKGYTFYLTIKVLFLIC